MDENTTNSLDNSGSLTSPLPIAGDVEDGGTAETNFMFLFAERNPY
jgi:hypothetical protein